MRLPFDKAKLTSPFGPRMLLGQKVFHYGIDFVTENKRIYACEEGEVIVAGINGGYGKNIMIKHRDLISVYGHLSEILVKEGQYVKEGELIGFEGSTGKSTGSHLHFEFRKSRWRRSSDMNPAHILNFIEKRQAHYAYEAPEYIQILQAKTDNPERWLAFIKEMEGHSMGRWLPTLIEKLNR